MITREELESLQSSCAVYYGHGGRYGEGQLPYPDELPRLFVDADYYNLPTQLADLQPGERALDILCGNCTPAALTIALARSQPEAVIVGLDPSAILLETCRDNVARFGLTNVEWVLSDDEKLDVPDGSIDVIVNRLGAHHIVDMPATLAYYRRILREGGRVVLLDFTVPDGDSEAQDYINDVYRFRDNTHVKIRTAAEVVHDLGSAGFRPGKYLEWSMTFATPELGLHTAEEKCAYLAKFRQGSSRVRSVHNVRERPDGEIGFTHPAFILQAFRE
jgi:ubiquinone/menaquinone biosynthesis C-methylase UbiE